MKRSGHGIPTSAPMSWLVTDDVHVGRKAHELLRVGHLQR